MLIFNNIIVLPFLLLNVSPACHHKKKDDNKKDKPTHYLDQDFKDYNVFSIGSYWIYEDSASGAIDTITLMTQQIEVPATTNFSYYLERTIQNFNSSFNGSGIVGFGFAGIDDKTSNNQLFQNGAVDYANLIYFSGHEPGFVYSKYTNDSTTYSQYLDSLNVFTIKFTSVKKFTVSSGPLYAIKTVYISKKVGIIRKELFNGQVWKLKKFQIN